MAVVDDLAVRIPDTDKSILEQAANDAEGAILDICNRTVISPRLYSMQLALAEVYARRILAAGEASRSEGDVSVSNAYPKEIPSDLSKRLLAHRKLKQAGIANETQI